MNINYYPHHINDWKKDTSRLSLEQRGVYRELLDALYACGGKIPADLRQLGRMIGVQTISERKSLALVVSNFLKQEGEYFSQKRVESELVKIKTRSAKASESAKAKNNNIKDLNSANAERTLSERTASQKPKANTLKLASCEEKNEEEILPENWHTYAENKGVPDEQIYSSWAKFKAKSNFPWQYRRWTAWIDGERIKKTG